MQIETRGELGKKCEHCPVLVNLRKLSETRGIFQPSIAQRTYFGLVQTCRTIREEFRVSYLRATQVVVPLDIAKQYIETFTNGTDYPLHAIGDTVRVTGPTRRLCRGGVEGCQHGEKRISTDKAAALPYDNAPVEALDKLCERVYANYNLIEEGHIAQIRLRETVIKYSWEEQKFDSCWREGHTPAIVIRFKLGKQYGLRWSPATGLKLLYESTKLLNDLEPYVPKMIGSQCDLWKEE
jgi:hypothetical protein